jgi:ketosteroid isomerase-like protein
MSQSNVAVVKRVIDAYNRRDLDAFDELLTPDYEWFPALVRGVEGGSYRGREGVEKYFAEVRDTWEENRTVPDEFRDLDDRVLMLGRMEGGCAPFVCIFPSPSLLFLPRPLMWSSTSIRSLSSSQAA